MKTFKIVVASKRKDGTIKSKALFRVEAESEDRAIVKVNLVIDSEHEEIVEVTEA